MTLQHVRRRRHVIRWARWALIGMIILLWARALWSQWPAMRRLKWQAHEGWLLLALVVLLGQMVVLATAWWQVLRSMGENLTWQMASSIWLRAQLARYLPGGVWDIAARAAMSHAQAIALQTVGAAAVVEIGFQVLTAGMFLLSVGFFFPNPDFTPYIPWLSLALLGLSVGILSPLLPRLLPHILSRIGHVPLTPHLPAWRRVLLFLMYSTAHGLQGAGFVFFAQGVGLMETNVLAWPTAALLLTTYIGAWVVGYISVFAPTGIGVREGVLVLLLAPYIPVSTAMAVALGYRVWLTMRDALAAVLGWLLAR